VTNAALAARPSTICSQPMRRATAPRSTPPQEGHSIVGDHVLRHVDDLLDKRALAQN
jgi:hypothetical protein